MKMTTIRDINSKLEMLAPACLGEAWDNDGIMLCGNLDKQVERVLVCLDVTTKAIENAKQTGVQLIISHHPLIFRPLKRIYGESFEKISQLIESDISVLSYHTRLDSAENGVNFALAKALGLCEISPYGGENGCSGRIGELESECSIKEFVKRLKDAIGAKCVRVGMCDKEAVKKVALLGGSGKDFVGDAQRCGCDVFVTGEVPHNVFLEARSRGIYIVEAGHYFTENQICQSLCQTLKACFEKVEFTVFDNGAPYEEM